MPEIRPGSHGPDPTGPDPTSPDPTGPDRTGTDAVDTALLDRLRSMWSERDPVPDGLVDELVAAVAVADLESEWLLLEPAHDLLADGALAGSALAGGALAGVRGRSEVDTVQFQLGDVCLTVRISAQAHGRSRFDGWLTGVDVDESATVYLTVPTPRGPAERSTDDTRQPGDAVVASSTLDRHGRFAFADVARGRSWQLKLDLGTHGLRFETTTIDS